MARGIASSFCTRKRCGAEAHGGEGKSGSPLECATIKESTANSGSF
jgi:hypothetical protein